MSHTLQSSLLNTVKKRAKLPFQSSSKSSSGSGTVGELENNIQNKMNLKHSSNYEKYKYIPIDSER